jgi:hypothetical protein
MPCAILRLPCLPAQLGEGSSAGELPDHQPGSSSPSLVLTGSVRRTR